MNSNPDRRLCGGLLSADRNPPERQEMEMSERVGTDRVLILGDIEGITGVDDWRHIMGGHPGYDEACRAYEADLNAAAAGLLAGGAAEVLVVDTHAAGLNVRAENLPGCRLIGGPSIMGRIDEAFAIGVDALVLLGFHVAAGTPDGFVPHSFAVQTRSWLDGKLAGEPAFYAHLAGDHGIPTIAITGDAQTIAQLRDFVPAAHAAQTKASTSPWRASSFDPASTHGNIAATLSLAYRDRNAIPPCAAASLITLKIEAQTDVASKLIATIPGMVAADGRISTFAGAWPEVWRAFITANSLAALAASAGGSWYFGAIADSLTARYANALGDGAKSHTGAFYAAQFSPPWGPPCPPDLIPWNADASS
jgi:D-amino peptidase